MPALHDTAARLVTRGKGILAADESVATMSARLEAVGVAPSAESRRAFRELLLTTPHLSDWVSGVILCDETLGQRLADGTPFPSAATAAGMLTGVKVDTGTTPLPFGDGGVVTEGLDGLRRRLDGYAERGAAFAKWRAVITPLGTSPRTVAANAHALARYAALCQESGVVPVVETEVLMDGAHGIAMCQAVTGNLLAAVVGELERMGVDLRGAVLMPNMVVSGATHPAQADAGEVARRTLQVLRRCVPASTAGVAFLSGGQSNAAACANLAGIVEQATATDAPWRLTYSFGRALSADALSTWRGAAANVRPAQQVFAADCRRARDATWPSPGARPVAV